VARVAEDLRAEGTAVAVHEWDVQAHPEAARRYRLLGPLGVVINGFLEITGLPSEEALRETLQDAA
jgi:hypothetical protein